MPHLLIFSAIISLQVEGYTVVDVEVHHGIILDLWLLLSFHALDPLGRREREGKFDLHHRFLVTKAPNAKSPKARNGLETKTMPAPKPPINKS